MSDRVIQSYHDSGERAPQPLHSYHSLWMSRWAGASCNTALQEQSQLSSPFGTDEVDHGTKQLHLPIGVEFALDISDAAKEFRGVKTMNFEIINKSPIMSSRNLRNDRASSQDSPIISISQKCGSNFVLKNDQETKAAKVLECQFSQNSERGNTVLHTSGRHFPSTRSVAPLETETSPSECHIEHQSLSQNPKDLVKSHRIFGSRFTFTRSLLDDFTGTASHVSPQGLDLGECRFDTGGSLEPSLICTQEKVHLRSFLVSKKHLSDTNISILEQEKCNYHNDTTVLVGKQKMDSCSTSGKSVIPCFRKVIDSSMILNDPSRSSSHSPEFCKEKYQRMQNHSGSELSPSWSTPPAMNELEALHRGCCLHTKPSSTHDTKTMRICTSVDSVEGASGSRPKISQATHSLLIAKRTDANLCKENHIFRGAGVLDQLKENSSSELHSFPLLCGHSQRGVKLGEGKESVQDVNAFEVVPKNELSAEMDTMDMVNFKENHLSGVNSSPSNKGVIVDTNSRPNDSIASAGGEAQRKRPIPELPDINMELSPLLVEENSMDNADPSTSKTQSLDIDLLQAEQPSNAKSNHCPDGHLGPEWSSRWIKRLKMSASGSFSIGTKSLKLGKTTSHEKVNKFVSRIIKGGITNSEPTLAKSAGKELMVPDQKTALVRNGESSSVDNVDNGADITLSHFWIQRWLHNRAATPQKKPEAVVVCYPQSSKVTLEDFRKKQFPSIAAMALMGKAMNGFQPCQFQNMGTFTVWNVKSV